MRARARFVSPVPLGVPQIFRAGGAPGISRADKIRGARICARPARGCPASDKRYAAALRFLFTLLSPFRLLSSPPPPPPPVLPSRGRAVLAPIRDRAAKNNARSYAPAVIVDRAAVLSNARLAYRRIKTRAAALLYRCRKRR